MTDSIDEQVRRWRRRAQWARVGIALVILATVVFGLAVIYRDVKAAQDCQDRGGYWYRGMCVGSTR